MAGDFTLGANQLRSASSRCATRLRSFGCVARGVRTLGGSQLSGAAKRCATRLRSFGLSLPWSPADERLFMRLGSRIIAPAEGGGFTFIRWFPGAHVLDPSTSITFPTHARAKREAARWLRTLDWVAGVCGGVRRGEKLVRKLDAESRERSDALYTALRNHGVQAMRELMFRMGGLPIEAARPGGGSEAIAMETGSGGAEGAAEAGGGGGGGACGAEAGGGGVPERKKARR